MKATIINLYTGKSSVSEATKETKNTIVFVVEGQEIKFSKKTQQGTIVDRFVYEEIVEEIVYEEIVEEVLVATVYEEIVEEVLVATVYDVLNDYSLDISNDTPDMSLYSTTESRYGAVLVHNDYDEIHYLVSNNPNMSGKYLF